MSVVNNLLLATNNPKKLQEIAELLKDHYFGAILSASDFPHLPEPEENGLTFQENARIKADYYASHTDLITLADDSGLQVDALDGRPGVYSARYAPTDPEKISKLLAELQNTPDAQRTARFVCALCVKVPGHGYIEVQGTLEGSIARSPSGSNGFGYDPIFLVRDTRRTLAELSSEEKNALSHRGDAMRKITSDLLNVLVRDT